MEWDFKRPSTQLGEIVVSAVSTFVAGILLWPPGYVYWTASPVGDSATIGVVAAVAIALGAAIGAATDVRLHNFAIGGIIAYLIGMRGIGMAFELDSPVHLLLYGAMLVCFVVGAALSSFNYKREFRSRFDLI